MADGDYAAGLPLMEAHRYGRGLRPIVKPTLSFPEWTGERCASLLVVGDQGLGDQIQFCRFVPDLLKLAGRVTLIVAPEVAPLVTHLGATVLPARGVVEFPVHDAWVLTGSLPLRLGVRLETLSGAPYLKPPENLLTGWPTGLRFGVVWHGSRTHSNDHNRSMPEADAARLLGIPGAYSLHPEVTGARTMADTAAIIDRLEAVITVDTSVAHLAGAMGKRTLLMLPATHTDWRWLKDRSDSPWYSSVKLYRQTRPGVWADVIDAVKGDLVFDRPLT